jgi:hypothetical protein
MFTVDANNGIRITRGDTAALEITFEGDVPGAEDRVIAMIKKGPKKNEALWEKELTLYDSGERQEGQTAVPFSTYLMELESEDTQALPFGSYAWDLRILYSDGQITTPFAPAAFEVLEVVTDLPEETTA